MPMVNKIKLLQMQINFKYVMDRQVILKFSKRLDGKTFSI